MLAVNEEENLSRLENAVGRFLVGQPLSCAYLFNSPIIGLGARIVPLSATSFESISHVFE